MIKKKNEGKYVIEENALRFEKNHINKIKPKFKFK